MPGLGQYRTINPRAILTRSVSMAPSGDGGSAPSLSALYRFVGGPYSGTINPALSYEGYAAVNLRVERYQSNVGSFDLNIIGDDGPGPSPELDLGNLSWNAGQTGEQTLVGGFPIAGTYTVKFNDASFTDISVNGPGTPATVTVTINDGLYCVVGDTWKSSRFDPESGDEDTIVNAITYGNGVFYANYNRYVTASNIPMYGKICRSIDDGVTWTNVYTLDPGADLDGTLQILAAPSTVPANGVHAVCTCQWYGENVETSTPARQNHLYTTDNGLSWSVGTFTNPNNLEFQPIGLLAHNNLPDGSGGLWVSYGNSSTAISSNGKEWQLVHNPIGDLAGTANVSAVAIGGIGFNGSTCILVGGTRDDLNVGHIRVFYSSDFTSWTDATIPTIDGEIQHLPIIPATIGNTVLLNLFTGPSPSVFTMLRSTDGGHTFTETFRVDDAINDDFWNYVLLSVVDGEFRASNYNYQYRTSADGITWSEIKTIDTSAFPEGTLDAATFAWNGKSGVDSTIVAVAYSNNPPGHYTLAYPSLFARSNCFSHTEEDPPAIPPA